MKKVLLFTVLLITTASMNAQIWSHTTHFEDGTYVRISTIGDDSYVRTGRDYKPDTPGKDMYFKYEYRDKDRNYILIENAEAVYYHYYTETEKKKVTVEENGFKQVKTIENKRHFMRETVYTGQARLYNMKITPDTAYYTMHGDSYKYPDAVMTYSNDTLRIIFPNDWGWSLPDTMGDVSGRHSRYCSCGKTSIGVGYFYTESDKTGPHFSFGGRYGNGDVYMPDAVIKYMKVTEVESDYSFAIKQQIIKANNQKKEEERMRELGEANSSVSKKSYLDFSFLDNKGTKYNISIKNGINKYSGEEIVPKPFIGTKYTLAVRTNVFDYGKKEETRVLGTLTIKNMPYYFDGRIDGEMIFEQYEGSLDSIKLDDIHTAIYIVPQEYYSYFYDKYIKNMSYSKLNRKYPGHGYGYDYETIGIGTSYVLKKSKK